MDDDSSQPIVVEEDSSEEILLFSYSAGYDEIAYTPPFIRASYELEKLGVLTVKPGLTETFQKYLIRYRCRKSQKACVFCLKQFEFNDLMVKLPCDHFFHDQCLKRFSIYKKKY